MEEAKTSPKPREGLVQLIHFQEHFGRQAFGDYLS
jgi:hypothetical protein